MNKIYKTIPAILVVALIFYFTFEAYASIDGRVLRTSTVDGGCGGTSCHGTSSSSNTQLSLQSGPLTVDPLSTNSYKIRVSNSSKIQAGINIATKTSITGSTNIGSFTAPVGSGLQVMVSELTHTEPKNLSNSNADFDFNWTAPSKPGVYYLRAVGNAVNQSSTPDGDEWNWMTPIELTVRGVELSEPLGGQNFCTGRDLIIKWTSAGIEKLKIELSADGGSSWSYTLHDGFIAIGGSFTWSIPSGFQQGNRFRIRLSDVTNPSRKSEMTSNFGIFGQFTISKHPVSKDMCPGESVKLYVNTSGEGVTYQWRKNGSAIVGATDSTFELNNVNSGNTGYYGVIVSSNCYSPIISDEANIQVRTPTIIKKQAQDQAVCLGDDAIFEIETDGHAVKFQWFRGAIPIDGATTPILTIKTVSSNEVGEYYCEVSGFCGTINSANVKLELNEPPKITKQAISQQACENTKVTLSIDATGINNVYEWYFKDSKIDKATSKSYVIDKVNISNAGEYYCIVKNNCGNPVKSEVVELTTKPQVKITQQPQSMTVMVGDLVEFSVVAVDASSYQWRKNNSPIPNANSNLLTIDSVTISDAGDYDCVIINDCGNATTVKAKLTVNEPEPGARINFASLTIDFGNVFEEQRVDSLISSFITNIGNETLIIDSIRIEAPDTNNHFAVIFEDSSVVEVGESLDFQIGFIPKFPGAKTATLNIYSNSVGVVPQINLRGTGAYWDIVSNRSKVELGDVLVGSSEKAVFRIFNQSESDITWTSNTYDCGSNESYFSVISPVLPSIVKAHGNSDVEVEFAPLVDGSFDCFMNFMFWGTDKTFKVTLKGVGLGSSVTDYSEVSDFSVYPNPSNNDLMFSFTFDEISEYTLDIYNLSGRIVRSHSSNDSEGLFVWDGRDDLGNILPSGSYTAILKTGKSNKAINILLIK